MYISALIFLWQEESTIFKGQIWSHKLQEVASTKLTNRNSFLMHGLHTSRKVMVSSPDEVIECFKYT
jgi:hypothetical protein